MIKGEDILSAIIDACQQRYKELKAAEAADPPSPHWLKRERDTWSSRTKRRRARIEALHAAEPMLIATLQQVRAGKPLERLFLADVRKKAKRASTTKNPQQGNPTTAPRVRVDPEQEA